MTPAEIAALIQLAELLASKGIDAYAHMKELAAKNGITDADMAAADAEFAHAGDKLDSGTSTIGDGPAPPAPFPYDTDLDAYPDKKVLNPGDRIYQRPTGKFNVVPVGVGINIPADWRLIETIG